MSRHTELFFVVALFALCSACVGGAEGSFQAEKMYGDAEDISAPESTIKGALLNGTVTQERPEIGRTVIGGSGCTGTLIAPQVMISARHCLKFTTCEDRTCVNSWGGGQAIFTDAFGRQHFYDIERWTSFDQFGRLRQDFVNHSIDYLDFSRNDYWTSDDVALVRLVEPVPASVAQPAPLTATKPQIGEGLTVWGYGCTERATRSSDGNKRYRDFSEGVERSNNLCPGDSGGPVTRGRQGSVLYVNSAFTLHDDGSGIPRETAETRDVYGDVLHFDDLIRAELAAWGDRVERSDTFNRPEQPAPQQPAEPEQPQQPAPEQPQQPEQPEPFNPAPSDDIVSELVAPIAFEDGSAFGLAVTLDAPGSYTELQIDMEVHHASPGEIMLVLHSADGRRMVLQEAYRNPAVYRSYIIPNFDQIDVRGEWVLEFHDVAFGNTGELRGLKFTWAR